MPQESVLPTEERSISDSPKQKGWYFARWDKDIMPVWFDGAMVHEMDAEAGLRFSPDSYDWFGPIPTILEG